MAPPVPATVGGPRGAPRGSHRSCLRQGKELSRLRMAEDGGGRDGGPSPLAPPRTKPPFPAQRKTTSTLKQRVRKASAPARASITLEHHHHPALGMLNLTWEGGNRPPSSLLLQTTTHPGPGTRRGPHTFGTGARGRLVGQDGRSGRWVWWHLSPYIFWASVFLSRSRGHCSRRDKPPWAIRKGKGSCKQQEITGNTQSPRSLPRLSSHLKPCGSTGLASRADSRERGEDEIRFATNSPFS